MATTSIVAFGEEYFDHVPTAALLKIVKSKKPYDIQDIVYSVWYNRAVPMNKNLRTLCFPPDKDSLQVWMGDEWRPRLIDEIIQRMIETVVQRAHERLEKDISEEDAKWLLSIPSMRGREYTLLCKGIRTFIFSF